MIWINGDITDKRYRAQGAQVLLSQSLVMSSIHAGADRILTCMAGGGRPKERKLQISLSLNYI